MKIFTTILKSSFIAVAILFSLPSVFAQTPEKMSYQAVIRNAANTLVINQTIGMRVSVLQGSATGTEVYKEIYNPNPTTNSNGLITVEIGTGIPLTGTFASINWSNGIYFIKTETDPTGGTNYSIVGTSQLMSVPYALYAKNSGTPSWGLSGNTGTNPATNFIGTADDNDVVFKRDNLSAGKLTISNTSFGVGSLNPNTTGLNNTATGADALGSNTTGYDNTANGRSALFSNTTGSFNTANGNSALFFNTTGSSNTANGRSALVYNTTGSSNTANGSAALAFNTTGFRNTANGANALRENTTGGFNTANGAEALRSNTTGNYNTANGRDALLSNTTGSANTANGAFALRDNTTGIENTANGFNALRDNTAGVFNTANGNGALLSNTTGSDNTAIGRDALFNNTAGSGNVALGFQAGFNETGSNKLYIANTSTSSPLIYGEFNTKIVEINGATKVNSSSSTNADLILGGMSSSAQGDDGIISSDPDYLSSDILLRSNDAVFIQLDYNNDEIGEFQINSGSNLVFQIVESGNAILAGSLTQNSDRRLKKDIEILPYGLKEILQLQPKAYHWKDRVEEHKSLGLIAQDVQPIIKEIVTAQDDDEKTLGISYSELIPVLINAIKEQQLQIEDLKTSNKTKDTALVDVLARLKKLENTKEIDTKNTISLISNK